VLKGSAYASDEDLDAIEQLVGAQAERDAYRGELVDLVASYRAFAP
jgi:hypothetical protein